jgi:hypothetical protein
VSAREFFVTDHRLRKLVGELFSLFFFFQFTSILSLFFLLYDPSVVCGAEL